MCISYELCSDIAAALLVTKGRSELELTRLKEIVIEVHTALQRMSEVERVIGDRLGRHDENEGKRPTYN